MQHLDSHELAWAAGLFDGEGHIRCDIATYYTRKNKTRAKHRVLVIQIGQNDDNRFVLERFSRAVGGIGSVHFPYQSDSMKNPRATYKVSNFEHVQFVIIAIWKFLSPTKRTQARLAIQTYLDYKCKIYKRSTI